MVLACSEDKTDMKLQILCAKSILSVVRQCGHSTGNVDML